MQRLDVELATLTVILSATLMACQAGAAPATASHRTEAEKFVGDSWSASTAVEAPVRLASAAAKDTGVLTEASASKMTTAELAGRLLPADAAKQVVSHEVGDPVFDGGPMRYVRFFGSPERLGGDLCRRQVLYVDLKPVGDRTAERMREDAPVELESLTDYLQVTAAPGCRLEPQALFAQAQPRGSFDRAVEALRTLVRLQGEARSNAPMDARISCQSKTHDNACAAGARRVFAALPIQRTYIIESNRTGWQFSVMPSGPGKPFWEVDMTTESGGRSKIAMTWERPAPF